MCMTWGAMPVNAARTVDTHEYIFEEPEEVARWFVHRFCESIELAGGTITEIRDDE